MHRTAAQPVAGKTVNYSKKMPPVSIEAQNGKEFLYLYGIFINIFPSCTIRPTWFGLYNQKTPQNGRKKPGIVLTLAVAGKTA